jgi:hypothetical protein
MSVENEAVGVIPGPVAMQPESMARASVPVARWKGLDRKNAVRWEIPSLLAYHEPARRGNSGHCVAILVPFVRKRVGRSFSICTYMQGLI